MYMQFGLIPLIPFSFGEGDARDYREDECLFLLLIIEFSEDYLVFTFGLAKSNKTQGFRKKPKNLTFGLK